MCNPCARTYVTYVPSLYNNRGKGGGSPVLETVGGRSGRDSGADQNKGAYAGFCPRGWITR